MSVLVDTCVWSLAFRRGRSDRPDIVDELRALILDGRVVMLGPVRQEILSGIRSRTQFELLRDPHLRRGGTLERPDLHHRSRLRALRHHPPDPPPRPRQLTHTPPRSCAWGQRGPANIP